MISVLLEFDDLLLMSGVAMGSDSFIAPLSLSSVVLLIGSSVSSKQGVIATFLSSTRCDITVDEYCLRYASKLLFISLSLFERTGTSS